MYLWNPRSFIVRQVSANHRKFLGQEAQSDSVEQVPLDDYRLPLSSAEILQSGSDLTVISFGTPLYTVSNALQVLQTPPPSISHLVPESLRGASVEFIDLRTILPWDVDTVIKSVNKTGRCVIVHEAGKTGGVGGEIAAEIQQKCFERLEAPVRRITGWE